MNTRFAAATETASAFLLGAGQAPPASRVEFFTDLASDSVGASIQLTASATELSNLLAWAGHLDGEVAANVLRREESVPFTRIAVTGHADDIPVRVWTHLREHEISALWEALGHVPEFDQDTPLSLEVLHGVVAVLPERRPQ